MKKTAHEISQELLNMQSALEEEITASYGEITDKAEELMQELETMKGDAAQKVRAYAHVVSRMSDTVSVIEATKKHYYERYKKMTAKLKSADKEINRMKSNMLSLMESADIENVKTPTETIFIREQSKTAVEFDEVTEADIEEMVFLGYAEMVPKFDKKKILSNLEEGKDLECLSKVTVHKTTNKSLVIR